MDDNEKILIDAFTKDVKRRLRPTLGSRGHKVFLEAKELLLSEIRNHPVSQELINKTDPSKYLSGRQGSLFGFMGFEAGDDPVGQLLNLLDEKIVFENTGRIIGKLDIRLIAFVKMPDVSDFDKDSSLKLPWESGKSWPVGVELGISGLPHFLSKFAKVSRSSMGIQIRGQSKNASEFTGTKFLSEIFDRFRKRVINRKV